jgi:hypothetical protein
MDYSRASPKRMLDDPERRRPRDLPKVAEVGETMLGSVAAA